MIDDHTVFSTLYYKKSRGNILLESQEMVTFETFLNIIAEEQDKLAFQ